MRYQLQEVAKILSAELQGADHIIRDVITDSRRITGPDQSLFIAIKGERFDGHDFLEAAYAGGIRSFLVQEKVTLPADCSVIHVADSLKALHDWAAHHRSLFSYPVIGITGSYGKTSVKERLASLLGSHCSIIRSPRSYNSQVGVPLSVLGMEQGHELAIFEAGISEPGEMKNLARIIRPDIGIFTGLGEAHHEHFSSHEEHLNEKLLLFQGAQMLVYELGEDEELIRAFAHEQSIQTYSWGHTGKEDLHILSHTEQGDTQELSYCTGGKSFSLTMPLTKGNYFANEMHCLAALYALGEKQEVIKAAFKKVGTGSHILEHTRSHTGSVLLTQTGLLDAAQLSLAIAQLTLTGHESEKIILLIETEAPLANSHRIDSLARVLEAGRTSGTQVICLGKGMKPLSEKLGENALFLSNSDEFHAFLAKNSLKGDLLISGSWSPFFMSVRSLLQGQGHHTRVTIDMEAVVHNLNVFREALGPDVKVMAMVKASAYGSGDTELARLLEFHRIDHLGVAYADEGIHLRRQGIRSPIMVMNSSLNELERMLNHELEPVIYSASMLQELLSLKTEKRIGIHLEFDTGMHRLGISEEEAEACLDLIAKQSKVELISVFSHLLASDDSSKEEWTKKQLDSFDRIKEMITSRSLKRPMYHILNTSGILRYPAYRMDMVRLGIGLYGHEPHRGLAQKLSPILRWDTEIRQVKTVKKGETIGYGGNFIVEKDMNIAILPLGYADGIHRSLGHGKGKVFIQGKSCPTVGSICMDMCMVDLKNLTFGPGEPVEIIGPNQSIEELAESLGTIAYEVLTSIPTRVKRTYVNG